MSKTQAAMDWAVSIAADSSHGYDQNSRWGPDYDCSSLVISAWEAAGVPVKSNGATYTGNMRHVFINCGFRDVTKQVNLSTGSGLQAGDVLLHEQHHTAMYLGGGRIVHASINENGTIKGGQPGDQTGGEICTRSYYNYPWGVILRYKESTSEPTGGETVKTCSISLPVVQHGDIGGAVLSVQNLLLHKWGGKLPKYGADGDFGDETHKAVRAFQTAEKLTVDGVVGAKTWAALHA